MKLIPEWRRLVRKAWSIRLMVLAGALTGAEMALPLFSDAFPRNVFLVLSMITCVAGLVARLVAQPKLRDGD